MPNWAPDHHSELDEFLQIVPDFMAVLDEGGSCLRVSRAGVSLHGHGADEFRGKAFLDFVHPDDRPAMRESLGRALSLAPGSIDILYRFRRAEVERGGPSEPEDHQDSGPEFLWMEGACGAGPLGDLPRAVVVVSRDATQRMGERQRAEELSREKDAAFREILHRVKNSIAMISSFISLEEGKAGPGELRSALESLRFRVDSISTLYRMQFASGDAAAIDLGAYLEKLIFDISQTLDRPDVVLSLDLAPIPLDTKRAVPLGILCTELVSNAVRHGFGAEDEGRVAVSLGLEDERLSLVVEDDGRGLPEGFRLASQDGLGLSIAKMLAQQLKGKLAFDAPGTGKGARFALSMPFGAVD